MSTNDQRAIIRIDAQQRFAAQQQDLQLVWEATNLLDDIVAEQVRDALRRIQNRDGELAALFNTSDGVLRQAADAVNEANHIAAEMQKQRDMIAEELHELVYRLENGDWSTSETMRRAYEQAKQQFWYELPLDLAQVLGTDFERAELMVALLSSSEDELYVLANDESIPLDLLKQARTYLVDLVRQLQASAENNTSAAD